MDIIFFTSIDKKSGGARQALYLAQGFHERGHNVTFFLPWRSTLRSIAPDFPCFHDLGEPSQWRKNVEAVIPQGNKACVVHAFHNAAVKRAAWWGLFWKKRAVVVAHRGVIYRPNNPLPYWSPGIDAFLVNSAMCGQVLQKVGLSASRLYLVPNSVPDDRIAPQTPGSQTRINLGFAPTQTIFGTVANNNPVKGVNEFIRAFATLVHANPNTPLGLLILGVDPKRWQPLCAELGIENHTRLVDHTEDVASHLAAMDIFVQPSLSESMPNTLLEAVRMGIPSIGTTVGAIPEVLADCGRIVPAKDIPALTNAMQQCLDSPQLVASMHEKTLKEGIKYTPNVRLDLVESIYLTLAQKRGLVL